MARDRKLYRLLQASGVALVLLAGIAAIVAAESVAGRVAVAAAAVGVSALAIASHFRLRLGLVQFRREISAMAVRTPSTPMISPAAPPLVEYEALTQLEAKLDRLSDCLEPHALGSSVSLPADDQTPALDAWLQKRRVGVIGSDELTSVLGQCFDVVRLYPTMAVSAMTRAQADTVVIEEAALAKGPWRSALDPQGARLFGEIREIMNDERGTPRPSYIIAAADGAGLAARGLRQGAVVIDGTMVKPDGAAATLLDTLMRYRAMHG